jgi:hypothetical protein
MSKLDVRLQFRRLASALEANGEVARGTGHATTTGQLRELVFSTFLRPHLPKHLHIRSGVIIDSVGNLSAQQDCVLVDSSFPIISVGAEHEALLLAESVVATVEIKSFLSTPELRTTMDSIRRTKQLVRSGVASYSKGGITLKGQQPAPVLPYVFAFDGAALNTLAEDAFAYANELDDQASVPEVVCVLGKGVVSRTSSIAKLNGNHLSGPFFQPTQIKTEHFAKDSLLAFYRRFIDDVAHLRLENADIEPYYAQQSLE